MRNNTYEYVSKKGLKICYIHKPKFKEAYVGIGVNYGSRDIEFYEENVKFNSPKGLAHFIEHKLFEMPEGDAFAAFSKLHASANAYTDTEKTIYYFTTTMDLYPPLKLLLEMYFTPYFSKVEVEKEKSIILSEIKMHADDVQSKFFYKTLQSLYPNSSIPTDATGTLQSVKKTTAEDLNRAYQSFYTTDNSYLVIVSAEPRKKVLDYVEEILATLDCRRGLPQRDVIPFSPPKTVPIVYSATTEQTSACLGIRLDADCKDPMLCTCIIGILDSLFSPMAQYYKVLHKKNAFYADIDYSITSLRDTSYCLISTTTNHPELFLNEIEKKLKNIKKEDLDEKITELYQKHLIARSILAEDEIASLGEETLVYALEGNSYPKMIQDCLKLSLEELYGYLPFLRNGKYVKTICEKSEK